MKMTRRAALAAASATLAAPALAQGIPELRSIRATAKSWLWIVEDYAGALGAFERAGVKVLGNTSGRGVNVDTLLSNAAEILLGAPTVTMRVQVRRQPIKMICGMVNKYASHVVVKKSILEKAGVTEASPVLEKAKVLKGLRMGTTGPGAAPDFLLRNLLVRAGFKPDTDAQLVTVQGGGPGDARCLRARRDRRLLPVFTDLRRRGLARPGGVPVQHVAQPAAGIRRLPIHRCDGD